MIDSTESCVTEHNIAPSFSREICRESSSMETSSCVDLFPSPRSKLEVTFHPANHDRQFVEPHNWRDQLKVTGEG